MSAGAGWWELVAGTSHLVIDFETLTVPKDGEKKAHQRMITLGAVLLVNGERRGEWHWLANPGHPIDSRSSAHNGITDEDIADAPDPSVAIAEFDAILAAHPDAALVCHNAPFDIGVLRREHEIADVEMPSRDVFDTMLIGARLKLPDMPARTKLTDIAARYGVRGNTVRGKQARTHKGLKDARDCADVFLALLGDAATLGIDTYDKFSRKAGVKDSATMASTAIRRERVTADPDIPASHLTEAHTGRLPDTPTPADIETWVAQVVECVGLRCPYLAEKAEVEQAHAEALLKALGPVVNAFTQPGEIGTYATAVRALFAAPEAPRHLARSWWAARHEAIKAAPACTAEEACPTCALGDPCSRDTLYETVATAATRYGYGITHLNAYKGLFQDNPPLRGVRMWAQEGLTGIAAYALVLGIRQYRADGNTRRAGELLDLGLKLGLHEIEPHLALETALRWDREHRHTQIDALIPAVMAHADTNPAYADLSTWYDLNHLPRRNATSRRKPRAQDPKRQPSPLELRPDTRRHTYRYNVYARDL